MTPERILIVLLGAIGDVVRAMPLAMRVRQGFPRARIAWAVEPLSAPLLEGHPAVDEVLVFRRDLGPRAFFPFLAEVRRRRFDLTLDLQRHLKSGIVSRASRAPVRIGFHRRNSKEENWLFNTDAIPPQEHWSSKLRQYLAFAEHLGLSGGEVRFGLALRPDEEPRVDALLAGLRRPYAAVFVGSTWESRFWWPEATAAVLRTLDSRFGLAACLLGSSGEREFASRISAGAPPSTKDLTGRTTLRDLMGIFQEARIAFGPDSGPMHIAAAMGTPVISLWGTTSPLRSAPFGSEDLAVVGTVACHPCYLRRCPIDRLCMRQITPEAVVERIERALARRAA